MFAANLITEANPLANYEEMDDINVFMTLTNNGTEVPMVSVVIVCVCVFQSVCVSVEWFGT